MQRALSGAAVKYTIILINGGKAINGSAGLVLKTALATAAMSGQPGVFPPANLTSCALDLVTGTAFVYNSTDLPANKALVCSIDVSVTSADIAVDHLPSFTVTASTAQAAPAASGYPATATVDSLGLYSLPRLATVTTFGSSDPKELGEQHA